jgi:hypothetical protein
VERERQRIRRLFREVVDDVLLQDFEDVRHSSRPALVTGYQVHHIQAEPIEQLCSSWCVGGALIIGVGAGTLLHRHWCNKHRHWCML